MQKYYQNTSHNIDNEMNSKMFYFFHNFLTQTNITYLLNKNKHLFIRTARMCVHLIIY